ncbi:hypothetical protein HDU79_006218 [Rhizoclosmatium sp. JEL0117]|nr:hypothetical protein HDU79_006218 [Rhizoclosmatium sp. JEL0117]
MTHNPGPTPPEEFNNQFPFDNDGFQSKNVHQESSVWNDLHDTQKQHAANEFSAPSTRQLTDPSMWALSEWSNDPTHKLRITSEIPVASFPTDVFADLLAAKVIPDPFVAFNEHEVSWVSLRNWKYTCHFQFTETVSWGACDLCFDGLDTVAEVLLNGTSIGKSDNMFVPLRISVTHLLTKNNVLEIRFESAVNVAKARELEYGKSMVWNGDASRVYLRKAQYHWGWDWGPTLVSCGVWRNVRLECYDARIVDVHCVTRVHDSLKHATLTVFAEVDISRIGLLLEDMACLVSLQTPTGITLFNKAFRGFKTKPYNDSHKVLEYTIENPELWFPIGTGKQPLYKLKCTLLHPSYPIPLSTYSRKLGIRRLELIETKLPGPGDKMTFYFSINNRPIFCAGSNWIPADSLLSRVTKDTYKKWLTVLVNGNQNMVRVWGGGVYEDDSFYELCDEMGILVWQDFMFACGAYPAHGEFVLSVEKEAQAVVKRLRRFASVAIFTGNNEDYAFAESYPELGYEPGNDDEKQWLASKFPARYIYERVFPRVISELWPEIPYKPGSPWTSNGRASSDTSSGDIHQWNVWHGTQEPYQNYGKLAGRFISEFGMQAFPTVKTTHSFFEAGTSEAEMDPVCKVVDFHNKATGFAKRLAGYVFENVRFGTGLNEFTYATQLMQAEALSTAYRLWKREWGSPHNRRVGGALVWQLNDCWPCVSWSICDYNLNPKPAYFSIKRELAPITLGIERRVVEESDTIFLDVWGVNTSDTEIRGTLVITGFDYESGHNPHKWTFEKSGIPVNGSVELETVCILGTEKAVVIRAQLVDDVDGTVICSTIDWPQPLRHLPIAIPDRGIGVEVAHNRKSLSINALRPVKGLWLSFGGEGADSVIVSDNMLDLIPGLEVTVGVLGLKEGTVVAWNHYK